MEVRKTITAELTCEDIKDAIADFASKHNAGDYTFDAQSVELLTPDKNTKVRIIATVEGR